MGFDLTSESGEEFRFTGSGWSYYLRLAAEYGWKPKGTRRPRELSIFKRWDGSYDSNEGQRVTADDARRLADALESARHDSGRPTRSRDLASKITAEMRAMGYSDYELRVDADDSLFLSEMVAFFRKGSFVIQ